MLNENCCHRIKVDSKNIEYEKKQLLLNKEVFLNKEKIFSLLGSDARLKITYLLLNNDKLCVCDISDILGMKQSPVSQHLRKLKDAEILISKREKLMINYYINPKYKDILTKMVL